MIAHLAHEAVGSPSFSIEAVLSLQAYVRAHYQELKEVALPLLEAQREYYMSGLDTVTLCISCHYKVEHGMMQLPPELDAHLGDT